MRNVSTAQQPTPIYAEYIDSDFSISEFDNEQWSESNQYTLKTHYDGAPVKEANQTTAQLLWSDKYLYVKFTSSLLKADTTNTNLSVKTPKLWEKDVAEIFIVPNLKHLDIYYEFEISPSGEWLDLRIKHVNGKRMTDWEYQSDVKAFSNVEDGIATMILAIPWQGLESSKPKVNDNYKANLFSIGSLANQRLFMCYNPTLTASPDFHVPSRFVDLVFVDEN